MRVRRLAATLVCALTIVAAATHVDAASAQSGTGLKIERFTTGDVSLRWSGSVRPPTAGLYTFIVTGDASDVWVDGVKVIEAWGDSSVPRFGRLELTPGVDLDFVLEVRAPLAGTNVRLQWQGPQVTRQAIPSSASRPTPGRRAGFPDDASLKDMARARGLLIGAAVKVEPLLNDARYRALSSEQFSLAPPEVAFIYQATSPDAPDRFPTEEIDQILSVTESAGQQSQAFHLLWPDFGRFYPWLATLSKSQWKAYAADRIRTLMTKYRGRVKAWNVANEIFDDNGKPYGDTLYIDGTAYPNWMAYSPTAIEDAFKLARATDPSALLFYNDYNIENDGPKWDGVLAMVRDFKARGIPIDGIGFQAHLGLEVPLDDYQLRKHFRQLNDLGVKVRLSELDVTINQGQGSEEQRLSEQAAYYYRVTSACLQAPNCDAINMWAVSDQYSWKNDPENGGPSTMATIFDSNFDPKPAYYAMNGALRGLG
jgi:endo-1,4-beta-xylanase